MILIGCDPEVFLKNSKTGKFVSAAGLFPGTKQKPHPIDKGAIQVDGTALEFNINAAKSEDEFVNNIRTVYRQMEEMVRQVDKDLVIEPVPVATFDKKDWENIPETAKELGCDPDYNYMGSVNPNPADRIFNQPIRTGSGHIHIGWTEDQDPLDALHFEDCKMISRGTMDTIYQLVSYDPQDQMRWQYYGMQGSFRPKPYGIELRGPSNRWIRSEHLIRKTYRQMTDQFHRLTNEMFK